jgi:RNA polymerase sigma factor (sigma-70 family)
MKTRGVKRTPSFAESALVDYGAQLHRFLVRRLRHTQDAEDLAQEVFMRLSRIEVSEFVRKPRAYLFGVAWHVVCEFKLRSGHSQRWVTFDSDVVEHQAAHPAEIEPDDLADRLAAQEQLREALGQLPPMHLAVLLLHKRDGYSYEEISSKLKLPARKIETYLAQAKASLRAMKWDR